MLFSFFRHKKRLQYTGANKMEGDYVSQASPIIVGGSARSGTTLMRVMLDTHSHICIGPESWLFTSQEMNYELLAKNFDLPEARVRDIFEEAESRAEFIDRFFSEYCATTGKQRWGEKTPANIEQLDFIFSVFPHARFIEMIRDGRDVACSLRTHPKYKVVNDELIPLSTWNPLDQCIRRWVKSIDVSRRFWSDPRYMRVRYEDLVLRAEDTLRAVFAFLNEPYEQGVLRFFDVQSASRQIQKFPQNRLATQALTENALGRWKNDLSAEDQELFKRIAGSYLIELGYETDDTWLSLHR